MKSIKAFNYELFFTNELMYLLNASKKVEQQTATSQTNTNNNEFEILTGSNKVSKREGNETVLFKKN
jgi:hypothetical protein